MNLLRQFDADNDPSRIVERLEPQHRAQSALHPAVVLLHNVVQVLTATNLHRVPPPEVELTLHSHAPQGAMARPVAIQGDAVWLPMMLQCLAKECLCRRDYYNSGFRLFSIMALASRVSRCCSVTVKRRSPLNHRVFPPPAVLTSVISLSSPRSKILMPPAISIAS